MRKLVAIVLSLCMAVVFMPCFAFGEDGCAAAGDNEVTVEEPGTSAETPDEPTDATTEATEPAEEAEDATEDEVLEAKDTKYISDEGMCGDDVWWEYNTNGTLTIGGHGEMWDFIDGDFDDEDLDPREYSYCVEDVKKVVIKSGVTSIGDNAFYNFSRMKSVSIPSSVRYIGDESFGECSSLTTITIPKYAEGLIVEDDEYGDYQGPFCGCTKLTTVKVASGCVNYASVKGVLFSKDKSTLIYYPEAKAGKSYTVPKSVNTIVNCAFISNTKLKTLVLPVNLEQFGNDNLCDTAVNSVSIPTSAPNFTTKDGVLFDKEKTELILYPPKKANKSYEIPDGVTVVDTYAFGIYEEDNSPLNKVLIPDTVELVGEYAFGDIPFIIFRGDAPAIGGDDYFSSESTVLYDTDRAGWSTPSWHNAKAYPYPNELNFEQTDYEIGYGDYAELNYTYGPENAFPGGITLTSSNPKVAKIVSDEDGDFVEAVMEGSCTVTATLYNGNTYDIHIDVYPQFCRDDEDMFDEEDGSLLLWVDEKYTLSIGAAGKVTWKTSNKKIATVTAKGVVKGIREGDCTITAVYKGEEYECDVYVLIEEPGSQYAYIDDYSYSKNTFYVEFENLGEHSVTVLAKGAQYWEEWYDDWDEDYYYVYRSLKMSKNVTIKPNAEKRLAFKVKGKKLYDTDEEDGEIYFYFKIQGQKYLGYVDCDGGEYYDPYEDEWYDLAGDLEEDDDDDDDDDDYDDYDGQSLSHNVSRSMMVVLTKMDMLIQ